MKKYRFRKPAIIVISTLCFAILILGAAIINTSMNQVSLQIPDYDYVTDTILNEEKPVANTKNIIMRPYNNSEVKILKDFYERNDTEENQENSLIFYDSTYMPNSSIAYGGIDSFDVVSILDGTVIKVSEDDLLGNIVEIEHTNKIISVYQSVSEVAVKENQVVKQGEVIAKSGESNLNLSLKKHLLFELIINSNIVNPEDYFNKNVENIGE
ncbi:MAG: M23 family metallopeptidase [Bacilli bacterium]|nr:M23 family metallopeptidase [Bacilli bacterium]